MTLKTFEGRIPEILIVDDTLDTLHLLSTALREQGYDIRSVSSGERALMSIHAAYPDLILLDILMPGKSGYEVCEILKAEPKTQDIPIIFMSAIHESFDKVKAFSLGAVDYITKPFQMDEVIARIHNQLELRLAQEEILQLKLDLEQRVKDRTAQLQQLNQTLHSEILERRQIEQSLRSSEAKFRQLSEHIHEVFWLIEYDAATNQCKAIAYISPGYEELWGRTPGETYQTPWQWVECIHEDDRQRVEESFRFSAPVDQLDQEYRVVCPDGSIRWIRDRSAPVYNDAGIVYRIAGVTEDITERKQAELERDRFFHLSLDLLFTANHCGEFKQVNPCWQSILGYSATELLGLSLRSFIHPDDGSVVLEAIQSLRQGKDVNGMEVRLKHKDGRYVWIAWNIAAFPTENLIYGTGRNISERKIAEARLVYETLHDSLTGLDNRASFMQRLELALKKCRRNKGVCFAVLFIDLDGFKGINDTLGHLVGDQLLVNVANILKNSVREVDSVARLGGDEFTILLEDLPDLKPVIDIADRIQAELKVPIQLKQHVVHTDASIGIVSSSSSYKEADDIIRDADIAMYRAKAKGKGRYEVFDRTMYAQTLRLMELENDLYHAIARNQFYLQFQPIVSLGNHNKLEGFEALLRWLHPEKGWVSPHEFIPIAENNGLINAIGQWVLHQACSQFGHWRTSCVQLERMYLSVNLSGRQLQEHSFPQMLAWVLEETNLPPSCLKLEITESTLIQNPELLAKTLEKLQNQGMQISLDDFGTGFSSLSYLHQFPIDVIKIDRSFIHTLDQDNRKREIVQSIIMLAHTLGITTIAEGIETAQQLEILLRLGCNAGQGFFFAQPMSLQTLDHACYKHCFQVDGLHLNCSPTKSSRAATMTP